MGSATEDGPQVRIHEVVDELEGSNRRAIVEIATDVLRRGVGGRLATTLQYQEQLAVGSGTVQKALRSLRESRAVSVRAKGHMGTFITSIDASLLWQFAGLGALRIQLTPPGAVETHGLMNGLKREFSRIGIPVEIEFVPGGEQRLRRVLAGKLRVASLSSYAGQALIGEFGAEESSSLTMPGALYYSVDSLEVLSLHGDAPNGPLRVAIDRGSRDHEQLTFAEFPDDGSTEYVACKFSQVPASILAGVIDTGVWHRLLTLIPLRLTGLSERPLRRPESRALAESMAQVLLVWRASEPEVGTVLRLLDPTVVRSEQQTLLDLNPDSEDLRTRVWMV